MSRKSLQKNLSYDDERRLYYVTLPGSGRRRHTKTFRSYEEALRMLNEGAVSTSVCPGAFCSLGQWLDWWLREDVSASRAASTLYAYQNIVRTHILPALGTVPLRSLNPLTIQNYLSQKLTEGLSPNTVLKHYTLLFTVLRKAAALKLLPENPMEQVVPPRRIAPRYTFYSPEQLRILFRVVEGSLMELPVKLAAYLGLRRSEIAGLRWRCVDLSAGIIVIQEVRTEVGGREVVKLPKTQSSIRRLGISGSPELVSLLQRTLEQRHSTDPEEYVVLKSDGTPPTPNYLTEALLHIVRENHLPPITLHGLRHSFASVANSQGVPMYDISKALGHSSISVTSNIYTHLFDETESRTLQAVAQAIRP